MFDEMFAKGDLSFYEQFVDVNFQLHCPSSWQEFHPVEIHGEKNAKQVDTAYSKAFKFNEVTIEEIFANDTKGEKILVRWKCKGTHIADYFGIKAQGKPFSITGVSVYHFNVHGKIAEMWQSWDMFGLLSQIGALSLNTTK
jgi:predicted ester cyclase